MQSQFNPNLDLIAQDTTWEDLPHTFHEYFSEATKNKRGRYDAKENWEYLRSNNFTETFNEFDEEGNKTSIKKHLTNLHYQNYLAIEASKNEIFDGTSHIKVVISVDGQRYDSNFKINDFSFSIKLGATFKELKAQLIEEAGKIDLDHQEWCFLVGIQENSRTTLSVQEIPFNIADEETLTLLFKEHIHENSIKIKIITKDLSHVNVIDSSPSASTSSTTATTFASTSTYVASTATAPVTSSMSTTKFEAEPLDVDDLATKWDYFSKNFKDFISRKMSEEDRQGALTDYSGGRRAITYGYRSDAKIYWESSPDLTNDKRISILEEFRFATYYKKQMVDKLINHGKKIIDLSDAHSSVLKMVQRQFIGLGNAEPRNLLTFFRFIKQSIQQLAKGNLTDISQNPLGYLCATSSFAKENAYVTLNKMIDDEMINAHKEIIVQNLRQIYRNNGNTIIDRRAQSVRYVKRYFVGLMLGPEENLAENIAIELMSNALPANMNMLDPGNINIKSILNAVKEGITIMGLCYSEKFDYSSNFYHTYDDIRLVSKQKVKDYVDQMLLDAKVDIKFSDLFQELISICQDNLPDNVTKAKKLALSYFKNYFKNYLSGRNESSHTWLRLLDVIKKMSIHPDACKEAENQPLVHSLRYLRAKPTLGILNDIAQNYKDNTECYQGITTYFNNMSTFNSQISIRSDNMLLPFSVDSDLSDVQKDDVDTNAIIDEFANISLSETENIKASEGNFAPPLKKKESDVRSFIAGLESVNDDVKAMMNVLIECSETYAKNKNKDHVVSNKILNDVLDKIQTLDLQNLINFQNLIKYSALSNGIPENVALRNALSYLNDKMFSEAETTSGLFGPKSVLRSADFMINRYITTAMSKINTQNFVQSLSVDENWEPVFTKLIQIGLNDKKFLNPKQKQEAALKWLKENINNIILYEVDKADEGKNKFLELIENKNNAKDHSIIALNYLVTIKAQVDCMLSSVGSSYNREIDEPNHSISTSSQDVLPQPTLSTKVKIEKDEEDSDTQFKSQSSLIIKREKEKEKVKTEWEKLEPAFQTYFSAMRNDPKKPGEGDSKDWQYLSVSDQNYYSSRFESYSYVLKTLIQKLTEFQNKKHMHVKFIKDMAIDYLNKNLKQLMKLHPNLDAFSWTLIKNEIDKLAPDTQEALKNHKSPSEQLKYGVLSYLCELSDKPYNYSKSESKSYQKVMGAFNQIIGELEKNAKPVESPLRSNSILTPSKPKREREKLAEKPTAQVPGYSAHDDL